MDINLGGKKIRGKCKNGGKIMEVNEINYKHKVKSIISMINLDNWGTQKIVSQYK